MTKQVEDMYSGLDPLAQELICNYFQARENMKYEFGCVARNPISFMARIACLSVDLSLGCLDMEPWMACL